MSDPSQSNRAGVYVRQPTGYRAFMPAPLPPVPPIALQGELPGLLSQADRALGRLDGSVLTLPNPDLFIFMYVRKEAVLSSQIEGTQSSLQDVLAAEAELFDEQRPHDVGEVINYVRAMHHGLARLSSLPVSLRLVLEIHAKLMRGVRGGHLQPGELRRSQNWIGPPGSTLATAAYVPPPAHEVPQALGDWERFLHARDELPPLVRIALAHVQFETIHPFLDGNGQAYYDHLQAVRDHGDWEGWLAFFLRGVIAVAGEAAETARRIQLLREAHRTIITEQLGRAAGNGHRVLERLFDRPIVSVADVQQVTGTTYVAANTLVRRMAELGIISEMTGYARNRRFRYQPYVQLFTDEVPA
jgi:Fic family protein